MSGHSHSDPLPPAIMAQVDQDRTQANRAVDALIGFHRKHTEDLGTSDYRATVCLIGKLIAEVGSPDLEFALALAIERLAKR